jgi:membrane protease YdiL (CAAX protease family)
LLQRWSPRVAIGVSSILFALLHADSLQHIIAVVPLAVVTGLLAFRSNSVRPGMLVHAIHNTAAVGLGALMTALTPQLGEEGVGMLLLGVIVALGLLGLPATIALFRNRTVKSVDSELAVEMPAPSFLTDSALVRQLG